MYTYSTNWMGPINQKWIEENGNQWAGGRIDIYGGDEPYPGEISVPLIHKYDWWDLTNFLDTLSTEKMLSWEEIKTLYEETNPKIRFFKEVE